MEFRILGPLEVVDNGGSLALGGARQRALLVVLLLHRSEAVSTDRLIDELWGERVPATAAKTVQGYVSQLRKVLGDGVILTQGRGYLLAAQPEQVDVRRFELLAGEGRRALVAGDAVRARAQLGAALSLWRGDPLGEFAYEPFAQNEIVRLQESRVAAYEDRIDADLALGRDAELTGEIEALVADHPLRERLRAQLMLSLYRSGRQADALTVYRQTSTLLRDELGLEPGPLLKKLERMILDPDDSLDDLRLSRSGPDGAARILCPFKGLASRRTVYSTYSLVDAAGRPTGAYLDRWDLPRGQPASTARAGYGPFLALSVSDRGDRVIAVTSGSVKIFDAHTLRLVRSITTTAAGPQTAAAVSPDGRSIVVGSGAGSVSFIDVSTGRVRRAITGHSGAVASAVYSPNGRTVVTVGDDDKVIIWNARTICARWNAGDRQR